MSLGPTWWEGSQTCDFNSRVRPDWTSWWDELTHVCGPESINEAVVLVWQPVLGCAGFSSGLNSGVWWTNEQRRSPVFEVVLRDVVWVFKCKVWRSGGRSSNRVWTWCCLVHRWGEDKAQTWQAGCEEAELKGKAFSWSEKVGSFQTKWLKLKYLLEVFRVRTQTPITV